MNIQIISAHLEQYRSVRDNARDALREYLLSPDHLIEDKWKLVCKYPELAHKQLDVHAEGEKEVVIQKLIELWI